MVMCKECGNGYVTGKLDFCSMRCFRKNIQKRIDVALKNEKLHIKQFSKDHF